VSSLRFRAHERMRIVFICAISRHPYSVFASFFSYESAMLPERTVIMFEV